MATNHAPTSRAREKPAGDEEASSQLVLGEFDGVPSLSLSEARLLINAVMDHRRKTRKVEETETLVKTQDYLDVFARFKQKENIEAVERLLASRAEFEPFERSQLGEFFASFSSLSRSLSPVSFLRGGLCTCVFVCVCVCGNEGKGSLGFRAFGTKGVCI